MFLTICVVSGIMTALTFNNKGLLMIKVSQKYETLEEGIKFMMEGAKKRLCKMFYF